MEIWMPLRGYEGAYEVSDQGRVRSITRSVPYGKNGFTTYKGRVLKTFSSKNGYACVKLAFRCVTRTTYIHEAVLLSFVGPRPDLGCRCEIRHLDGVKSNNNLSNLMYGTTKENAADRKRHLAEKFNQV